MPSEAVVERTVCAYAEQRGMLALKFTSPGRAGVPDRIFIGPYATIMFIEFKAPGKKPSVLQTRHLSTLRNLGHFATWVDSIEAGKKLIDKVMGSA